MTYDYRSPRRLNLVSGFLLLCVLAAGYAAWKFVPVYWQERKVDEALDEVALPAAQFGYRSPEARQRDADAIVESAIARLHDMGIQDQPDQPLQVWFNPEFTELHAKYRVVVTHPAVLKPTVLDLERVRKVPQR